MPRRAALIAVVLAALAVAPAAAPAARSKCGTRACVGKVRAMKTGVPRGWPKRALLPGTGGARPGDTTPAPGDKTKPGGPPPPPPPPPPPDDPRFVSVSAYDKDQPWRLVPSRTALLSGTVTVQFNNSHAQDPHNLWLQKGGVTHKFDVVDKETTATRELALTAGTWKLWCQIGDHEQLGMVASVTVTDG